MKYFKELVVKSNELIEMPVDFNLMQLKLFAKIVVSIRENPDSEYYSFFIKNLLDDFDLTDTNYTQLKKATKGLIRPVIIKGKGIEEDQISFFEKVSYSARGVVKFKMSSDLKPLIIDLEKNYTKYYFSNIARLKSAYSIRFYEILKQYQFRGERVLSLNEIREILKIHDSKYKQYGHFKEKVILVSQRELKEKTDIYFDFEEIKEGRKIVNIKFIIFRNEKNALLIEGVDRLDILDSIDGQGADLTMEQQSLLIKLIDLYQIDEKLATVFVTTIELGKIEKNIEYSLKEFEQGKISKNLTGYLIEAIKHDYANRSAIFEIDNKSKLEKKKKKLADPKEALKKKLSLDFARIEKKNFINGLSEKEKIALVEEILEEVKLDNYAASLIKKKGLNCLVAGSWIIKKIEGYEQRKDKFIKDELKKWDY